MEILYMAALVIACTLIVITVYRINSLSTRDGYISFVNKWCSKEYAVDAEEYVRNMDEVEWVEYKRELVKYNITSITIGMVSIAVALVMIMMGCR